MIHSSFRHIHSLNHHTNTEREHHYYVFFFFFLNGCGNSYEDVKQVAQETSVVLELN